LDEGKIRLNIYIPWAIYRTIFRSTAGGSGASFFSVIGGFLNAATSSLKRVTERIFKEASKNLVFDFLINKDTKKINLKPTAYILEVLI
jgi:hypothetical protein